MGSRRADYGTDAPAVTAALTAGAVLAGLAVWSFGQPWQRVASALLALVLLLCAASALYTSWLGKRLVWSRILERLDPEPTGRVLDLGCGRGAALLAAADTLGPGGIAVGVDRRCGRPVDAAAIAANAAAEGLADRVSVVCGDMRALPFPDASFDVVLSSVAVHDIRDAPGRAAAVREAVRVLRPGGRIAIADVRHHRACAEQLSAAGFTDIRVRRLSWRFSYAGPWGATWLVSALRPVVPGIRTAAQQAEAGEATPR
ncbi:methyltransferase domain-containing protein [Saccharopolyspora sp. HNM0983]|uniref:Methyltransferase domain-containing protein n=1 Tax=Saccharopolyspora montiporae TaxID=2781240 RepID=A0A929BC36_9PSEU|nr:methyltransferase domain-containing protein [Saccharopolyspora sp. HNM0983]MBE9376035.1 methyltransferase domain-containing protein [Saccharopolyspora sp. HNM0983]